MADQKISQLTAATTPLAGTEVLPIVQSGATVKVSVANLTAGRDASVKKLTATDNVVISTAGKGIDFSANSSAAGMTSELLTWYEEGTFSPTLAPTTSGTITASGAARYTRIGRMVMVEGYINVSAVSSPVGELRLGGFPYALSADSNGAGSMQPYGFDTVSANTALYLMGIGGTTTAYIRGYQSGNQVQTIADNAKNGTGFQFSFAYTV